MTSDARTLEFDHRLTTGDRAVLSDVFTHHRDRLTRMIELRMDQRIRGRVDASDVIQDAYTEASDRLDEYLSQRPMPVYLWLRFLVSQRLVLLHRQHLGTARRDASRDVSLYQPPLGEASSVMLADGLAADLTSPSEAAVREETRREIQRGVEEMEPLDREIIALRHFEQLSRSEAAQVLNIEVATASKRYLRALRRLRQVLQRADGSNNDRGNCDP